jgi:hypothetical protein
MYTLRVTQFTGLWYKDTVETLEGSSLEGW